MILDSKVKQHFEMYKYRLFFNKESEGNRSSFLNWK